MATRVYCSECKHYDEQPNKCNHPANMGDWYDRRSDGKEPSYLNCLNDCEWHKSK
jgi:hypothetical protein